MKKLVAIALIVLLMGYGVAWAAQSLTETITWIPGTKMKMVKLSWVTSDTGAWTGTNKISPFDGTVVKFVADPGATAPSDNYDVYIYDATTSQDILQGSGLNLHTSTTQERYVGAVAHVNGSVISSSPMPIRHFGPMTFSVSGNANADALGDMYLFIESSEK